MEAKISRRKFLKLSGVAAFSPFIRLGDVVSPRTKAPTPTDFGVEKRVPLRCRMCAQQCPAIGIVKDGKLIKMEANPHLPYSGICGRSRSTPAAVYNPDRLKYPLLRVGKRGEGKFKRISWEEALDRIAKVLKKYRKEAPEKVVYLPRFTSAAGIDKPFWHLYGTPNIISYADTCHSAGHDWGLGGYFGRPISPGAVWMDYPNAKFGVLAMRNPGGGLCVYQFGTFFAEGKRNGLRLVSVDVRFPNESIEGAGHRWLPIRPGTDPAFHLALAHVIVKKKGYDEAYLIEKTNACMLIDPETLEPFKAVIEEKEEKKGDKTVKKRTMRYLVWDEAQGKAVFKSQASKPALLGEFEIEGKKVITAFEAISRALERYTPQWAEKITTVPAKEIEAIAEELIKNKPQVFVDTGWYSERYANSLRQFHAIGLVNTLLGCWEKKGGIGGIPKVKLHGVLPKVKKPKRIQITKYYQKKEGYPFIIPKAGRRFVFEALRTGKPYEPKVIFAMGQNFIGGSAGSVELIKLLDKVELIVCMTPFMDESCLYADIILPDTMFPERNEALHVKFKQSFPTVAMNMKAVEPPFEARPGDWVMVELAKRVLFSEEFEKYFGDFVRGGWEYGWRKQLEGLDEKYPGITLERLKKEGVWYGKQNYKIKKKTLTHEIEIFSLTFLETYKKFKEKGYPFAEYANPLPSWAPPFWWEEKKGQLAEDEFILTTGFSPLNSFTGGQTRNNPLLREIWDQIGLDRLWIHPERAQKLGIQDGDVVEVFPAHNPEIRATARVWITPLVHPDALFTYYGVGAGVFSQLKKFLVFLPEHGVNMNHFSKLHFAPLQGGHATQDVIIKIRRA
ncbi:molybdopterin-containing oxidoreductase family protein [Thermosulfurimonas dismutans]|uniref:Molybdopterin oxydoreductase, catalytic subunit A n=1 Tax=Thermosulfurimonas dismutans TaxID=999894 RepID=A0A179D6L1_9BACT|nr:molybdopterin-dependent oxidoreductase [Thermosulfurimonas dismutans]OAQ21431.1 Molybdopterin oxydoreductase, catalytic subunit A [Thermosulfurimonas dismutans]